MRIHLIAIGGSIMHNLALALKRAGHNVTGSDDEIYNPARDRLKAEGLLPNEGWSADRIDDSIELIILGMHAKADNPELKKARNLGLKVVSFPEFIGEQSINKKRIVVAGSHGKTTTTSMVLHVLQELSMDFDYLVGAQIEGFDLMVSLSDAAIIVIEGDEYLSSCLDPRPKIMHYDPDISVITGVAWDHVNVFPTFDNYKDQFRAYINSMRAASKLYYHEADEILSNIVRGAECEYEGYEAFEGASDIKGNWIEHNGAKYPVNVFGEYNRANLMAAFRLCNDLGVKAEAFFQAISTFKGASKRMELLFENGNGLAFRDFAHAPSKVKATVKGIRERYPIAKLKIVLELHTYSSLRKDFIPFYKESLAPADEAIVMYSPKTLEIKKMPALEKNEIYDAFSFDGLKVVNSNEELLKELDDWNDIEPNTVLMWMSSGRFGGIDFVEESRKLLE